MCVFVYAMVVLKVAESDNLRLRLGVRCCHVDFPTSETVLLRVDFEIFDHIFEVLAYL